jgi:trigger factor
VEQSLRAMNGEGVDLKSLKLDWAKVKETQRDKAVREVKASCCSRIAEREAIHATRDEVDKEVENAWRAAAGTRGRAAHEVRKGRHTGAYRPHIQTEKTLTFLFEQARKTA